MNTDWRQVQTDREIDRLGKRIDRIEHRLWEERQRRSERTTRAMFAVLWFEVAAIWAFSIARSAGAL